MANFEKAFERLKSFEYNNKKNALHYNAGEDGYTFMGIYQKFHPQSVIWENLKNYKKVTDNIEKLSVYMSNNIENIEEVKKIYKKEYWDMGKLDYVKDQEIAEIIFIIGVNIGIKKAIKIAQRIVNVTDDGVVGPITLKALNSFDENKFIKEYKERAKNYYTNLAINNSKYQRYLQGWLNRVELA